MQSVGPKEKKTTVEKAGTSKRTLDVKKSTSTIEPGKSETELECWWQSPRMPTSWNLDEEKETVSKRFETDFDFVFRVVCLLCTSKTDLCIKHSSRVLIYLSFFYCSSETYFESNAKRNFVGREETLVLREKSKVKSILILWITVFRAFNGLFGG